MTSIPTAAALTTDNPIIPFVQLIKDDERTYIEFQRHVENEKRKARIALLENDDRESCSPAHQGLSRRVS